MNDGNDPRDAYLERMLEEEYEGDEAPDLTGRIAEALEKPAPRPQFRRTVMQIAASILFFVSIISAILLIPSAERSNPAAPTYPAKVLEALDLLAAKDNEEIAARGGQLLVDMGEEVLPYLEQAIPDLGDKARRVIEQIKWKDALLSREEVLSRFRHDRITSGVVPTNAYTPAPVLRILEDRTGVPIVLLKEITRRRDAASYLELTPDSSSYTILRDVLAAFELEPVYLDGGVVAIDKQKRTEKELLGQLLENLSARDTRRRAVIAGMIVQIAKDDFGYNPYGTRERRLEAQRRIYDWYKSLKP